MCYPKPAGSLVPAGANLPATGSQALPEILHRAGKAAVFAAEEFFYGKIRNAHTRTAYLHAVKLFLAWCEEHGLELVRVTPKDIGLYFDGLQKKNLSVATRKQHLAALGKRPPRKSYQLRWRTESGRILPGVDLSDRGQSLRPMRRRD